MASTRLSKRGPLKAGLHTRACACVCAANEAGLRLYKRGSLKRDSTTRAILALIGRVLISSPPDPAFGACAPPFYLREWIAHVV
jgi:hypothetical protein